MRTTYNKLNNHALVFIEITKAWLFFIIIITKLANKAKIKDFVAEVDFTLVRDDLSSRSNCETIGAVKRGGIKVSEITITEKTEETVLQKALHSIINLALRFMCFSFKFATYIIISFIQMVIDFLYNKMEQSRTISSNTVKIENDIEQSVLDEVCAF